MKRWLDRADAWLEQRRLLCALLGLAGIASAVLAAIAFGRPGPG